MFSRRLKTGYFIVEGLNSFAMVYYCYYFYFFMQQAFGYGNKANLVLAAISGGVYAVFSFVAGRFAQRAGYFASLKLGLIIMAASLSVGWWLGTRSAAGQIGVMLVMMAALTYTWPPLEALISEEESTEGLPQMIGVYNVVWAGTAAAAYFVGGALLQELGSASLFYVPVAIQVGQLGLVYWLEAQARRSMQAAPATAGSSAPAIWEQTAVGTIAAAPADSRAVTAPVGRAHSPPRAGDAMDSAQNGCSRTGTARCGEHVPPEQLPPARVFLRMAWLANPFAYIAIQTLVAVMPGIAQRLGLSTMTAGFCCSVWCFARLGAFVGLWVWTGWHYRFGWLLASYLALVGTFAMLLLAPSVPVLVLTQVLFGGAVGLIYYSSLFYSMDSSETKGEHGGIHEAAIGLGNCAGPAVGAAALQFLPQYQQSGALAVSVLLLFGLGGLTIIWRTRRRHP